MKKIIQGMIVLSLCLLSLGGMPLKAQPLTETEEKKTLYLTFDDGPSEYTEGLLDLLKAHHMKVTFFMLDGEMKRNPEVVKRMVDEGHSVGVHGVTHEKDSFYCGVLGPVKEMNQANDTLKSITGERTLLARTPYGSSPYLTKKQQEALESCHYILWDWTIDSRDWSYRNPQKTYQHTIKSLTTTTKEPKVILLHDIKNVVETVNLIVEWMENHQYTSEAITPELVPVKLWRKPNS